VKRRRVTLRFIAYCVAVLAVSLLLVFGLLAWFESRDRSAVGAAGVTAPLRL
jgi:hypothetical protein